MTVHVLTDFDNLPAAIRKPGLASLARAVYQAVDLLYPSVDELRIRLYGGWYDAQGLTQAGTRLAQEIGFGFPMAIPVNQQIKCRIHCEIASASIDAPADLLLHTFRQRWGIRSRLTAVQSPSCASPHSCGVQTVVQWSRGRCHVAGCSVPAHTVFKYNEQKLVDTLLCCDLIVLTTKGQKAPVFLISDDDDMIPAVLLGSRLGGSIHILQTRTRQSPYDTLLQQYNVQISAL
jgi:uncharacterized LabA/DUF88 family protein